MHLADPPFFRCHHAGGAGGPCGFRDLGARVFVRYLPDDDAGQRLRNVAEPCRQCPGLLATSYCLAVIVDLGWFTSLVVAFGGNTQFRYVVAAIAIVSGGVLFHQVFANYRQRRWYEVWAGRFSPWITIALAVGSIPVIPFMLLNWEGALLKTATVAVGALSGVVSAAFGAQGATPAGAAERAVALDRDGRVGGVSLHARGRRLCARASRARTGFADRRRRTRTDTTGPFSWRWWWRPCWRGSPT